MNKRRFFHITTRGKIKEIDGETWLHSRLDEKPELTVSIYRNEITIGKGDNQLTFRKKQLDAVLERVLEENSQK